MDDIIHVAIYDSITVVQGTYQGQTGIVTDDNQSLVQLTREVQWLRESMEELVRIMQSFTINNNN